MDYLASLNTLSHLPSVSGNEARAAAFFAAEAETRGARVATDAVGNCMAFLRCDDENAPTLLVDTHVDEIGFLVSEYCGGGFVKLSRVGGMDPGVLPASELLLYGKEVIRAVVAAKPPHLLKEEDRKKKVLLPDLYVDSLLPDETLRALCPLGTPAGFSEGVTELQNGRISSRGLDDRISGLALLRLLELASPAEMHYHLAALWSVQEEVGGMGAMTAAFGIAPDLCLCVDVGFAAFEGAEGRMLKLGKGAGVSFSDTLSRRLSREVVRVAQEAAIPVQLLGEPGETGTNAHEIQVTRAGVPSAILSIPLSYMHSPSELIDPADTEQTAQLMNAFLCRAHFLAKEETIVG